MCSAAPSTPAVTNITPSTATFSWNTITGATAYEYALNTSPTPPSSGAYTTNTSYTGLSLASGTTYYFHVRAFCSATDLSSWTTTSVFIPFKTGIHSVQGGGSFNIEVYPNPAEDVMHLNISGRNGASGRVQIVDMSGKVVQTINTASDKVDLDLKSIASGVYLLKYVDSENSGVIRIKKL
jgi:hypothetical protein